VGRPELGHGHDVGSAVQRMSDDIARIEATLSRHPCVDFISLAGSRARGNPVEHSDWDFVVCANDFVRLKCDLPLLLSGFAPLATQWDRLSRFECCMLLLRGARKVDLLFPEVPHEREPPWVAKPATLAMIDAHFWDWSIWLLAKTERRNFELVQTELKKMSEHILRPLGVSDVPASLGQAVAEFRQARDRAESRWDTAVPRILEREILPVLSSYW
jgi:hypothetical protein